MPRLWGWRMLAQSLARGTAAPCLPVAASSAVSGSLCSASQPGRQAVRAASTAAWRGVSTGQSRSVACLPAQPQVSLATVRQYSTAVAGLGPRTSTACFDVWLQGKIWRATVSSTTPVQKAVDQVLCEACPGVPLTQLHSRVQRVECMGNGKDGDSDMQGWEAMEAPVGTHNYVVHVVEPGLDQLLPSIPQLVQRVADLEAGRKEDKRQAAAANSQQVENLAAQIALLAVGASDFRTTISTRFRSRYSGSALVHYLAVRGVHDPAQQLDALVTGRNAAVHPSPLSQLRARVQRLQQFITPELRYLEPLSCLIVEGFEDILKDCKGQGFATKSLKGRNGL